MTGLAGLVATEVTRPLFEGMGPVSKAVFYAVAAVSTAVFGWGAWRRARKYRMGRAAGRGRAVRAALRSRLLAIGRGTSVSRGNRATGLAHFFILWGFLVALLATVILTFDTDVVRELSRLITGHEDSFYHGTFFLVFTFVVDTMGFAFLVALVYMAVRRGVRKPWRLSYARAGAPAGGYSRRRLVQGDWLFLGLLLAILVTAYLVTGLRILGQDMPWFSVFSPFGRAVAEAFSGLGLGRPKPSASMGCSGGCTPAWPWPSWLTCRTPRPCTCWLTGSTCSPPTARPLFACRRPRPVQVTRGTWRSPTSPGRNCSTSTPAPGAGGATRSVRRAPAGRPCRRATWSSTCATGWTRPPAGPRC